MAKQTFTTGQVLTAAQMTALQANDYNWTVSAKTASYVLVAADAGTRITMSNAGATTITVNTALFTAGDTLTITNIGAGACTITAGTATVSTAGSLILNQYDSGTLYFSSTSAAIWNGANPGDITGITTGATSGLAGGVTSGTASLTLATAAKGDLLVGTGSNTAQVLTVGSNNQTLVADSTAATGLKWATAGAGAANWVQISSPTVTAASSLSFTGLSGYKQLRLLMQGTVSSVANATAKVRFNANAGATAYQFNIARMAANAYGGDTTSGPDDAIVGNQWILLNTSGLNCLSLDVNDSNGTGYKAYSVATQGTNGSSVQRTMFSGYGMFISTTAISSIDITLSSGTMTCNTNPILWGVVG